MKTIKLVTILLFVFLFQILYSQDITKDTILANDYWVKANDFLSNYQLDSCFNYTKKAQILYLKYLDAESLQNAKCLHNFGVLHKINAQFDSAFYYTNRAFEIRLRILGDNNLTIANSYFVLGGLYTQTAEFSKAKYFLFKCLEIREKQLPENNKELTKIYNTIGSYYYYISDHKKALEFFYKSYVISINIYGINNINTALIINNLGVIFFESKQYNLSLDYYVKVLNLYSEVYGENYIRLADIYSNISMVYIRLDDFEKALFYLNKSLSIFIDFYGENNFNVASVFYNLGLVNYLTNNYEVSLDYYFKTINIYINILGDQNYELGNLYYKIGIVYNDLNIFDKALEYFKKSIIINNQYLGEKNEKNVVVYFHIANNYFKQGLLDSALQNLQLSIYNNMLNYNIFDKNIDFPKIDEYLNSEYLLRAIRFKGDILSDTAQIINGLDNNSRIKKSIFYFLICDTILLRESQKIVLENDKLYYTTNTQKIYKDATELSYEMYKQNIHDNIKYKELTFYFSERNKTSALLQSLSNSKALKYSGIPEELLKKEDDLKIQITSYTNLKNNAENDSIAQIWNNYLFNLNRSYDSIINVFEKQYPNYYNLKYKFSTVSSHEISNLLDKKTAMISYFISGNYITIHAINNKNSIVTRVILPDSLDIKIYNYVSSISESDLIYTEIKNNSNELFLYYKKSAVAFYNILFPDEIQNFLGKNKITNLIIIPDENLAKLPFETLLTEDYSATWSNWNNTEYFANMPYLIKKYNISYTYSASLYAQIYQNKKTKKNIAKYDWVGFAPVFDDKKTASTNQNSQRLLTIENKNGKVRSFLSGRYVSPLPSTKLEVTTIFDLFDKKNKTAKIYTYQQANEKIIKSDDMSKFKIIHIASHGFTNEFEPEKSAILLAQDTTANADSLEIMLGNVAQQNEGFLYQSEIYNLKFNADLVVLSACETGLGKVSKGEGVIGLTRALLYAGADNLIVSLWQVSDKATQILMVDFYKNYLSLNKKKQKKFAPSLRQAKLEMIKQGYHPYLWSSFILIGE